MQVFFFCLKLIIIHYHTLPYPQNKGKKFAPRIKLHHNIYFALDKMMQGARARGQKQGKGQGLFLAIMYLSLGYSDKETKHWQHQKPVFPATNFIHFHIYVKI